MSDRDDTYVPVTIVVPVDGSALSEMSVPLAHQLAARFGADVRTVTVGVEGHEVAADLVLDGDPTPAVLDHLANGDRTLVCMSSHGHGGIRRRLISSVAKQLIRRASTGDRDRSTPRPRRRGRATDLAGRARPRPVALGGRAVHHPHDRPARARPSGSGPAGAAAARQGVPATPHVLPGSETVEGLLTLTDRVPPPALLAVDSHHTGERVHHDVAYQLIRESRWPVLATIGT